MLLLGRLEALLAITLVLFNVINHGFRPGLPLVLGLTPNFPKSKTLLSINLLWF